MNGVLLFCNIDGSGKIIDSLLGDRVIPTKQYDYFFYIAGKDTETVLNELPNYSVVNGELQTA
jgi:hypothetical protein